MQPLQKTYVNLTGDVCRMYFFRRQCFYSSCRYRHCSPEETQALREASLVPVPSEAQSEALAPVEIPVPSEEVGPAPEVVDNEHEVCCVSGSTLVITLVID